MEVIPVGFCRRRHRNRSYWVINSKELLSKKVKLHFGVIDLELQLCLCQPQLGQYIAFIDFCFQL